MLRGPLAKERIERRGERVVIGLKKEWSDGSRELELSCTELVEKLVALVPRPRAHTVVYSGVFAAHHALRAEVVPGRESEKAATVARRRARKTTRLRVVSRTGRPPHAC